VDVAEEVKDTEVVNILYQVSTEYVRTMFQVGRRFAPVATASDEIPESSVHTESTEEVIDLKGEKLDDDSALRSLNLSYLDLWALALTTSIGGHYLTWCSGLTAGFGTFMIATILIASGFVCLLCCIAELSSAIPFAGK
jgi:amino acid permease